MSILRFEFVFTRNPKFSAIIFTDKDEINHCEGAIAQSVERATLDEGVLGLIPAVAARSLVVGLA